MIILFYERFFDPLLSASVDNKLLITIDNKPEKLSVNIYYNFLKTVMNFDIIGMFLAVFTYLVADTLLASSLSPA